MEQLSMQTNTIQKVVRTKNQQQKQKEIKFHVHAVSFAGSANIVWHILINQIPIETNKLWLDGKMCLTNEHYGEL